MTNKDKISAIHAREDIDLDEKRKLVCEVKAQVYRDISYKVIDIPWIAGDTTINVTSLHTDAQHRVFVNCEAWRNGVKLDLDLPFIYINPPLIHQDQESPLDVLHHIISETVEGF